MGSITGQRLLLSWESNLELAGYLLVIAPGHTFCYDTQTSRLYPFFHFIVCCGQALYVMKAHTPSFFLLCIVYQITSSSLRELYRLELVK
jgi:hypothetical protein